MANPNNPVFPDAVPTDLDLMVSTNRALSKIVLPISDEVTSFAVADGSKFNTPCLVQIDTEIIRVGSKSGDMLTNCTRGFSLTMPSYHPQNADVKGYIFSHHHNQVAAEIKAICESLGAHLGNVVTHMDTAGGDLSGVFTNLQLDTTGVTPGSFGGFNKNVTVTVDAKGRVTSITDAIGNRNHPLIYKAAILQDNNAVLGFSFVNEGAPTAVPYRQANGTAFAVASFTEGNEYSVQDHFTMPEDWIAGSEVTVDILWFSQADHGDVVWQMQTTAMYDGSNNDPVWSTKGTVSQTVKAPAYTINKTRMRHVPTPGIGPGQELFFRFSRSATDSLPADAQLISITINVLRDYSLILAP